MGKVKNWLFEEQEREYQRRYDEIAYERGLHPDDDAEEIEQILFDETEDKIIRAGLPGSAF